MKSVISKLSVVILGLGVLLSACDNQPTKLSLESATLLPSVKKLNDFKLMHFDRGEFTLDSIKGDWSMFFFGYTRCPDVCPTELFTLSAMMTQIEQNPDTVESAPQVVFVSVDPQQDKPEALQKYASYYHKSFKGVTGRQQEVDRLTAATGIFYERVYHMNGQILILPEGDEIPAGLENSYLINHSATIVLTNPDGDMHAVFSAPHDPAVMIRDLAAMQRAW